MKPIKFNPNDPKLWKDFDPTEQAEEFVDGKSQGDINRGTANRIKAQDPDWKKSRQDGLDKIKVTDEWREILKERSNKLKENLTWKENAAKANSKENWTEERLTNVRSAMKVRSSKKEWKQKFCKKIQTPDGIFESQTAAAKHYNLDKAAIASRRKKFPNEWFYLD